jgi:hypothetical protein
MGIARSPVKVKLFAAILFRPEIRQEDLLEKLLEKFGAIECSYGPVPFSFSDYYEDEMGKNLKKWYVTFCPLIGREQLPTIKNFTNAFERERSVDGKRTVNVDPGYIAADKLVLASTKDFYHRLYLGDGVYGEVTLHFRKGVFRYFSWSYPDYKDPSFLEFLTKARAKYMHEIREE